MAETSNESPNGLDNAPPIAEPLPIRPALFRDRSFWGMTATQFLGAFNDNLFKQLALLLAVRGAIQGAAESVDIQGYAMICFSAPFLLFSGLAGFLSERSSKRSVIVACKFAEIFIVLLGMAAFVFWDTSGIWGVLFVLFLMGTHSAFFGPGKYGVLPELFDERDLPQANGLILMTTFLAIIFGMSLAGWLKSYFGEAKLWQASLVCVAIAVLGTQTALMIRKIKPANPNLQFTWLALAVPRDVIAMFRQDRSLLKALLAYCMFWFIGGWVQSSVNALGKIQFEITDAQTSYLAACMAVGIAVGAVLAGQLSRHHTNFSLTRIGAWMIVIALALVAIPNTKNSNLLGVFGTGAVLLILGAAAGLFAVPLQVYIQARPPQNLKGRTIATMNLATWVFIILSAAMYQAFSFVINAAALPRCANFGIAAIIMLPVAIFYRPTNKD